MTQQCACSWCVTIIVTSIAYRRVGKDEQRRDPGKRGAGRGGGGPRPLHPAHRTHPPTIKDRTCGLTRLLQFEHDSLFEKTVPATSPQNGSGGAGPMGGGAGTSVPPLVRSHRCKNISCTTGGGATTAASSDSKTLCAGGAAAL